MNKEITVEIFGKAYQIKCAESESHSLQKAARLLEEEMTSMRDKSNMLSSDKILVAAALNIAHQFLNLENKLLHESDTIQKQLLDLEKKLDRAMSPPGQMELKPAE